MITRIGIKNFKSLEDVNIECTNLNVLTGLNGMGKSSVVQALLLLKQSHEKGLLQNEGLALNGDLVEIGTVKDALFEFAKEDEINFNIDFRNENNENINKDWNFIREINDGDSTEEEKGYSSSDVMPYSNKEIPNEINLIPLFKNNSFKYLNADRWVKNEYEISDFNVVRNRYLGKHGQYTSHYLNHFGNKPINADLLFNSKSENELGIQVSLWMSEISPGTKVKTEKQVGANSIKLRYVFEGDQVSTSEIKPLNVGFGITYVLPVIVALLSARKGDLLIIENPESHIHPKGQSVIGKLMARVANTGVQIFVETHSDHFLNGIRIAVKNGISNSLVKLIYISRGVEENKIFSEFQIPKLDKDGRIDFWPNGFFDEFDNNLIDLL
jgi:predicted ATPase